MTTKDPYRQGIVPGEILTKEDFCQRLDIKRAGWSALKLRAESAGFYMFYYEGRQGFVDTAIFVDYLKSLRAANASSK